MKGMHGIIAIVGLACFLFLPKADVNAEVFIDIYAGQSKTGKGKADITGNVGGITASGDVEYDSSNPRKTLRRQVPHPQPGK